MRVDVFPREADIVPGQQLAISVTVTNSTTVIGGYTLRVLGADPGWVQLEDENFSLFPDEVRSLLATITVPTTIPAGARRLAIQVRELTPPNDVSVTEVDLRVPAAKAVQVRIDPLTVTAGRSAAFSIIAENTGNTTVQGHLDGTDPESQVRFEFSPSWVCLAPGDHQVVDMRARARRRVIGSPTVRTLGLYLEESDDPFFQETPSERPIARSDEQPLANATFIQRTVLSRGAISLVGLLVAISVFATVITIALSRLVGQTAADRNLALQVAEARNAAVGTGTSGIAGTVRQLTSGGPESGVSVSVYPEADTSKPVATTATDDSGAYRFTQLAAGGYKLSFRGAGFVQVWYPAAANDSDATTVKIDAGQQKNGVDVTIGGVPATISGTVTGDDVSAATLYLETAAPAGGTGTNSGSARSLTGTPTNPTNPLPDDGSAIVKTVPIGSDGTFSLTDVPSPSVYQLVVTKVGYATSTQRLDVSAGEERDGVKIALRRGDGLISGAVSSSAGPLGGVSITATSGTESAETVSLTDADVGSFTLRSLPTPGTYTLVARKRGYTTQTLTLSLSAGQKLTGVAVTLGRSSGSLHGLVTTLPGGRPAGGVSVTVTDGEHTVRSETESTAVSAGQWRVGGLAIPGTYTITFARDDLAAQTVSASLDAAGNITPGSQGASIGGDGTISVAMAVSTATVYGTVTQHGAAGLCPGSGRAEATVTLNSGTRSYAVTTARVPAAQCGDYRIEKLPPGTYTLTVTAGSGTSPSSRVFTLRAGDLSRRNVNLSAPASVAGTVRNADGQTLSGWSVFLYAVDDYPDRVDQTVKTDGEGTFLFDGVDAGRYIVAVGPSADPNSASLTRQVVVQPSKRTSITIRVPQ